MVIAEVKGNKLIITADIEEGKRSTSGKSLVVATTSGFVSVPNSELKYSINVIKK